MHVWAIYMSPVVLSTGTTILFCRIKTKLKYRIGLNVRRPKGIQRNAQKLPGVWKHKMRQKGIRTYTWCILVYEYVHTTSKHNTCNNKQLTTGDAAAAAAAAE